MIYSLDSNACILHLRKQGVSAVSRKLATVNHDDVVICSIVRAELFFGALRSRDPKGNMAKVGAFLARFASVPFDDQAASHYAEIRDSLTSVGRPIGPNDLLIAAIARANSLIVVTHNVSEFSRVPGLRIEDWE